MVKGMKVLLKVSAQFHENYGFSWIVSDVDPTFTMGDMALKRKRIVAQLKEEGVFLHGEKSGIWKTYNEDGDIISSENYTVPEGMEPLRPE